MKKTLIIVFALFFVSVAATATFFILDLKKKEKEDELFFKEISKYKFLPAENEINNQEENLIPAIADCGSNKECFVEKFKKCESAKFVSKLELFRAANLYQYEIKNPEQNNRCRVVSMFLQNMNPEWEMKGMTCLYDMTKDFDVTITDVTQCSGELFDLMFGVKHNMNNAPYECDMHRDCLNKDTPFCFERKCRKADEELKKYITTKYGIDEDRECNLRSCDGCKNGKMYTASYYYSYGGADFAVNFCKECDADTSCASGYKCVPYKCIKK